MAAKTSPDNTTTAEVEPAVKAAPAAPATPAGPPLVRVRMCHYHNHGDRLLHPGQEVDLPANVAQQLRRARYAVLVDEQDGSAK